MTKDATPRQLVDRALVRACAGEPNPDLPAHHLTSSTDVVALRELVTNNALPMNLRMLAADQWVSAGVHRHEVENGLRPGLPDDLTIHIADLLAEHAPETLSEVVVRSRSPQVLRHVARRLVAAIDAEVAGEDVDSDVQIRAAVGGALAESGKELVFDLVDEEGLWEAWVRLYDHRTHSEPEFRLDMLRGASMVLSRLGRWYPDRLHAFNAARDLEPLLLLPTERRSWTAEMFSAYVDRACVDLKAGALSPYVRFLAGNDHLFTLEHLQQLADAWATALTVNPAISHVVVVGGEGNDEEEGDEAPREPDPYEYLLESREMAAATMHQIHDNVARVEPLMEEFLAGSTEDRETLIAQDTEATTLALHALLGSSDIAAQERALWWSEFDTWLQPDRAPAPWDLELGGWYQLLASRAENWSKYVETAITLLCTYGEQLTGSRFDLATERLMQDYDVLLRRGEASLDVDKLLDFTPEMAVRLAEKNFTAREMLSDLLREHLNTVPELAAVQEGLAGAWSTASLRQALLAAEAVNFATPS